MNNKTARCHECGSRFTISTYAKKTLGYRVIYLCRTCTYRAMSREYEMLGSKSPIIIPFVKRRAYRKGGGSYLV